MEISSDLNLAITAAINAGNAVMEVYNSSEYNIQFKKDKSPVTKADLIANEIICNQLKHTLIPILSEENRRISYDSRKNWKRFWLIDPLDGTKEFINKTGEFTINIAQVIDNKPHLGVIYCPVLKRLYYAEKSKGAYMSLIQNQSLDFNNVIKLTSNLITSKKVILVSRSHLSKKAKDFIIENDHLEVKQVGSSFKFCLLAEGEAMFYPRFAPIMEWDIAAGIIILEEARVYKSKNISFNTKSLTLEIDLFK